MISSLDVIFQPLFQTSGLPLSDAISPSQGANIKGPTATIKSESKINVESMSLGMAHNFKISSSFWDNQEGRDN